MKCKCGKKAVAKFRGRPLCRECFISSFEKSVESFCRKWKLVESGDRILVAVSGGKDSAALASSIKHVAEKMEAEAELLYIDLGIAQYSSPMKKAAEELASFLGMKLHVESISSLSLDIYEDSKRRGRKPCSLCGAVKRYIMNRFAYENRFTKIATGHNRDDVASFFMRNLPNPPALPPYSPWSGTAVARIRTLMEIGEKDAMNYAMLKGLPFSGLECPLASGQKIKYALAELEKSIPGIRDRIVRFMEKWGMEKNRETGQFVPCRKCGMPSLSGLCIICRWRV